LTTQQGKTIFKAKRRALTNLWPLIVYFNYLEVSGILCKLVRVNRVTNMEPLNISCQTSKTVLTFKANVYFQTAVCSKGEKA